MTWFKIAFAAQFCMREHNNFFNAFSVAFYWKILKTWIFEDSTSLFFFFSLALSLAHTFLPSSISDGAVAILVSESSEFVCISSYTMLCMLLYKFQFFFPLFNIYMKHLALLLRFHSIHILKQFRFFFVTPFIGRTAHFLIKYV